MSHLKAIFEDFAQQNRWNNVESKSGPGSTLAYTANLRSQLPRFVEEFKIKSFFDAPCGDFNWMREVRFPDEFLYIGGDISSHLVSEVREKYASSAREFIEFDITSDNFPRADVWFCRDCLFHLPDEDIKTALRNFAQSNIPYILMTNHINSVEFNNRNIAKAGGFRIIDFYKPPFSLPRQILFRIADYVHPHPQREMCVWSREQIQTALS